MIHTEKEFREKFKLIFSSLFARKMQYVVCGCPEFLDPKQLLFTNITPAEAEVYEPNVEHFIHLVVIKDEDFFNDLCEIFDIFKTTVFVFDITKLFAAFNKTKTKLTKLHLKADNNNIMFEEYADGKLVNATVCGRVISATLASDYFNIYKQGIIRSDELTTTMLALPEFTDKYTVLEIVSELTNTKLTKAYILDGKTIVSTKEFIKKFDKDGTLRFVFSRYPNAIKLNSIFECPLLTAHSVQPSMLWWVR